MIKNKDGGAKYMEKILIPISEASKISGVDDKTIYTWIDEGRIHSYEEDKKKVLDKIEFLQSIPTVITNFIRKGGVGKTTISYVLADYFEFIGLNVLLVDLDPQANLTSTFFTYEEIKDKPTLYNYFIDNTALGKIVLKYNENIDILINDIRLDDAIDIDSTVIYSDYLDPFKSLFKKYQIVIIDCPPAINTFSRTGVMLSNYVLFPLQPEPYSLQGINEAFKSLTQLKKLADNFIDYKAFINTFVKRKIIIRDDMEENFRNVLKDKLLNGKLYESTDFVERILLKENLFKSKKDKNSIKEALKLCNEIFDVIYTKR